MADTTHWPCIDCGTVTTSHFPGCAEIETETDPYAGKPWGEQQEQVDWLESRYDDQYESEDAYYGSWDD